MPALTDEALHNRYQILETDSGLQISEIFNLVHETDDVVVGE
jgi:hypothetical protein